MSKEANETVAGVSSARIADLEEEKARMEGRAERSEVLEARCARLEVRTALWFKSGSERCVCLVYAARRTRDARLWSCFYGWQ